jgi:glycosyltransferase involved in cell wall biosynthesis
MLQDQITPLILTFNEEANIGRVLERLRWAPRVVVLDSFSTDATLDIVGRFPNADVHQRAFDSFAGQCNYGLGLIDTPWVLSLDADYVLTPELVDEIAALPAEPDVDGFEAQFTYCIGGKPLRGTLYPPRTVLYRRDAATPTASRSMASSACSPVASSTTTASPWRRGCGRSRSTPCRRPINSSPRRPTTSASPTGSGSAV